MSSMDLAPPVDDDGASPHHHPFHQQPQFYPPHLAPFAGSNLTSSELFFPAPPHPHYPDATRGSPFAAPRLPDVSTHPLSASTQSYRSPSLYQQSPIHGSPYPPDAFYAESPLSNPYAPMAAPPLPNTPSGQQLAGTSSAPSPGTSQSPASQSREQQRVALLLEINVELLQEVNRLQAEGKGGAITPQQQAQLKEQGQPDNLAADDYIQCLRRVQANLSYLSLRAQNNPSKMPQGPMYMTPPPQMPQLQTKYDSLKELFPGWQGINQRMVAQQQQQQQQALQQAGASPSTANMGGTSTNGTPTQQ